MFAVCTFDLQFSYIRAGWEGSAHDARVLKDAVSHHGFSVPPGKYFLRDAGYSNAEYLLVPYRGTRYHLKEQKLAAEKYVPLYSLRTTLMIYRPQTPMELFNLHHVFLRNVVERIFEILKRRFRILRSAPEFPMRSQVNLTYVLTAIHNYIRKEAGLEALMAGLGTDELVNGDDDQEIIREESTSTTMDGLRESMTQRT